MTVTITEENISVLMKNINNIRNICVMAHVDHGKTTLVDSLIASNGIIPARLAGKLRYMDSRTDEQERGITMKSSAISLCHEFDQKEYLINLIDSPGHVDFSFEVSTALRICDGALIIVDVVEGVCPQTRVSLKHAWKEAVKPLLILNKIDRLILEMRTSPMDAYIRMLQILEQVNSIMGDLFRSDIIEKTQKISEESTAENNKFPNWSSGLDCADDSNLYFSPEDGSVIFTSAIDGWGFTIESFVSILSKKLGFSEAVLRKTLWGNFYLDLKNKRVLKGAQENLKKPLFVQLILENIWLLYETIIIKKDKEKTESIINSLNIQLPPNFRHTDGISVLRTLLGRWLPLASSVLNLVCLKLPSPNSLTQEKIDNLIFGSNYNYYKPCEETLDLRSSFLECKNNADAPVIVFISKMFSVEKKYLSEYKVKSSTLEEIKERKAQIKSNHLHDITSTNNYNDKTKIDYTNLIINDEVIIAFARIYSGCLSLNQNLYVLGPKHDPRYALQKLKCGYKINSANTLKDLKLDEHITQVTVKQLYLLMGRELKFINEVRAGNIFGIGGLEEHVLKYATLSSTIACPAFCDLHLMATPILRVAIEPENPAYLTQLTHGLKLLNQADASVQVEMQETGEQILVTTGEVHLQRCIEDLRERYAKVPLIFSEPIIPFRETIVPSSTTDMVNETISQQGKERNSVVVQTADNLCSVRVEAFSLPDIIVKIIEKNAELIKYLSTIFTSQETKIEMDLNCRMTDFNIDDSTSVINSKYHNLNYEIRKKIFIFQKELTSAFQSEIKIANITINNIWSFGPKSCASNILFNVISDNPSAKMSFWESSHIKGDVYAKFESNFISGFQLATLAGPLCEEPMMGVGFIIKNWEISEEFSPIINSSYGPFSGQLIYTVKEGCRKAFQMQPQRLMTAMYSCNITVSTEVLGRMYALLNKRHGRIVHGDLSESSGSIFNITAFLPMTESFLFASEVRKQTSGLANPQLVFSHWEIIELDPFWRPSTEEEYTLYGEKSDSENYARVCMNNVRKRKGLTTDEKIIKYAEKQRTLSKNK